VSPYGYEATRESLAHGIQKAFSLKGSVHALPTDDRFFSLGETEDYQPVLLWFGDAEPDEKTQKTIGHYGVEVTLLHALAAPPAFFKGQAISVLDRLQWKDKTGFKGKIQKPQSHKSISAKGGNRKGEKARTYALKRWHECTHQNLYQKQGEKRSFCDVMAKEILDHGIEMMLPKDRNDRGNAEQRLSDRIYKMKFTNSAISNSE
jgi:hypothetical protein